MADDCPPAFVDFAGRLADASGVVINRHFRTRFEVERKADETPVTIADRESEAAMRRLICDTYPDHGIVGEEHGAEREDAELVWILDPIDGTRAFIAGKPMFGTLIALVRGGAPLLGVIDQPVIGDRWLGARGRDTTFNGKAVRSRACERLGDAVLCTSNPAYFEGPDIAAFERLRDAAGWTQYSGDSYGVGLIANGSMDLAVESELGVYDFLSWGPVIEGAGGMVSDWHGAPLSLQTGDKILVSGDAGLHDRALARLAG